MAKQRVLIRSGWRYEKTIGRGALDLGYYLPVDVAVRNDGIIAVIRSADTGPGHIAVNTYEEEPLRMFAHAGTGEGQLTTPTCLAFDREGLLYVADQKNNRVSVFTIEGEYVSYWGDAGEGEGQLNGPSGMAFDGEDNLYLVDHRSHRVQMFSKEGRFLGGWGSFGSDEGQLNMPWGVTIDHEGNVFVADWRNDRIQKFTPSGEFLATYGQSGSGRGEFNRPSGVAVDLDGDIYVADWMNDRVQVVGNDGRFVSALTGAATLSKWGLEYLKANAEAARQRYLADDPDEERQFHGPVSVKLDQEGRLYVLETLRGRLQIYQKLGYPSPVAMEAEDLEKEPRQFAATQQAEEIWGVQRGEAPLSGV